MTKKKLIEVALPLEAINRESAREKSIRHGHPSTLHLWWARRPLAACRAVLFSQLVDDPSARPEEFPTVEAQAAERQRLFDLIERLVVWENINDEKLLNEAHAEILKSTDGNPPAILDPFAGGGSIPLEAQRLGLEAHASDLNPVAVLINKALIEIPPKFAGKPPVFPGAAENKLDWPKATGLAEDVRRYGQWMRDEAEQRIGHLYPKATLDNGTEANVIAWIWARTVTCPNPACGIQMPLVRSWWLGKKKGKEAYVVPRVGDGRMEFSIGHGPKHAPTPGDDGTVSRTGAVCAACGTAAPLTYVREEGKAGRMGAQLMAVVAEGDRRRHYLAPTFEHEHAALVDRPVDVPELELAHDKMNIKTPLYGMKNVADLFTNRQLTALTTFSDLVGEARKRVLEDALASGGGVSPDAYADAVAIYLGLTLGKTSDYWSSLTSWSTGEFVRGTFARQALPMVWDFCETAPLGDATGCFASMRDWLVKAIENIPAEGEATAVTADAATRDYSGVLVSTDPPYYDNIGYANLSDFFYGWLRRSLTDVLPELFATVQTPKSDELVADPYRHGGKAEAGEFFEHGFRDVFANIRQSTPSEYPITVFYAFKQSESDESGTASTGWQTLLEGMLQSGWEVTATWPMRTEREARALAHETNALASSIVLALRPRPASAEAINRQSFLRILKAELPSALRSLQQGSIAPVDLAQAAIGPGMAVFSRYARVNEADGSDMTVRTALALINQVLGEVLNEQEGDFDAPTRFAVKWFSQYGWDEGPSGEADVLARATNTAISALERGGVFRAVAGKARLLHPETMTDGWDPALDLDISVWEVAVRVAYALQTEGTGLASAWMADAAQSIDMDAVKELSYLLYSVSEKKGWTEAALLFNGLGTSWGDLAHGMRDAAAHSARPQQDTFDFSGDEGE